MLRTFKKNALIVFKPDFDEAARGFVEQSLQYRELYQHFYMLPVPADSKLSEEEINLFLEKEGITRQNTDAYLIRKKEAYDNEQEAAPYTTAILNCVKNFKKHSIAVTYDHYLGKKKFDSLKRFRQHNRYVSSQNFPSGSIAQIALFQANTPDKKTSFEGRLFFNGSAPEKPPYKYLFINDQILLTSIPPELDDSAKNTYQEVLQREIAFRQDKVAPIIRSAEQHYRNPQSISEKLANLFHAYAFGLSGCGRTKRLLAYRIANELYANPDWELRDCLTLIKEKMDHSPTLINPMGTLQGLMFEMVNMMHSTNIFNVDVQLEEYWEEKYTELDTLKDSLDGESKHCIENILTELKTLEKGGKPYAVLVRAAESTINLIKAPTPEHCIQQYQVAQEIGQHSWGRKVAGLSLCLLGICIGIGIGLATYFSGGAFLLTGPLVIKGLILSATLVNTGIAMLFGLGAATLPLSAGSFCLFQKAKISKEMEKSAELIPQQAEESNLNIG